MLYVYILIIIHSRDMLFIHSSVKNDLVHELWCHGWSSACEGHVSFYIHGLVEFRCFICETPLQHAFGQNLGQVGIGIAFLLHITA